MKYLFYATMMLVSCCMIVTGCHTHDHSHDSHSHGEPEEEIGSNSILKRSESIEWFIEYQPLIVHSESIFLVHLTKLNSYKPIEDASIKLTLLKNGGEIDHIISEAPVSPGIFQLNLSSPGPGTYVIRFTLANANYKDTIHLNDVFVFKDLNEASTNVKSEDENEINFLKEQAWRIDFEVKPITSKNIFQVLSASGEFQPIEGEQKIIAAKNSGIITFQKRDLREGKSVRSGSGLFTLSTTGLLESNLEERFKVAQARVENAAADFERAQKLIEQQIIGQKEFEKRKSDLAIARAEYQTYSKNYKANGQSIVANMTGIVKQLYVSDGEFVEEGSPLIQITNNRSLYLRAEVSQKYLTQLPFIKSANFKTPYQEEVQSIEAYNGKLISYGKMIERGQNFVPVIFELDNVQNLIPGSFAEVHLLLEPKNSALVVPKSALMQDFDSHYLYVQTGGESFEKKNVELGVDDGIQVQILSGVEPGDWVVTQGAYQLKMASMTTEIPAHGHSH